MLSTGKGGAAPVYRHALGHATYERHRPEQTLLYQLVEKHYPLLVEQLEAQGKSLPTHVHRELEAYLKCGRLEHGFLRVRCDTCHFERLVTFSCKKRGFCPSCGAHRMAETSALLSDEVFPDVPLRQWVISFPFPPIGAIPVYADIDPESLLICLKSVKKVITSKTRALILTHLFELMVDVASFKKIATLHNIKIVEDCAQAHGASISGNIAGSLGDVAAFSFYPTKNLGAIGDAGAVVTASSKIANRARRLRQYGWSEKYVVAKSGGRNTRLDELQAAVLRVKLEYLGDLNRRRVEIARRYCAEIKSTHIKLPICPSERYVAHLFVLRLENRENLRAFLHAQDVQTEIHYPVLDYHQPSIRADYSDISLACSEEASKLIVSIPCYPEMTKMQVEQVVQAVNDWVPPLA